ncbi:16S rRNA pseudouridine(516) synthase [Lactococcus garvieae]|uniref:16S rRNA pseudouridine(516) synthase n=1 Tax=Lactococcus garvieae TaxID=1363 RepID=UPI0038550218
MRLDHYLLLNGWKDKKERKRLIQTRKIIIDGQVEYNLSRNVDPQMHEIFVHQQQLTAFGHCYFMMNKPAGVLSANKDEQLPTYRALLKEKNGALYPVGRLDFLTTGLLFITDNGPLGIDMLKPQQHVSKTYLVETWEPLEERDKAAFAAGIEFIGGVRTKPAQLEILDAHHAKVTIQEGKYHQVKKMFLALGKKVEQLQRLSFGPLVIDEHLQPGTYRPLTQQEILSLKPYMRK